MFNLFLLVFELLYEFIKFILLNPVWQRNWLKVRLCHTSLTL